MSPTRDFGDSSQLTNCILDSDATCHITPDISDFILGSLEEIEKYIQFVNEDLVIAKQTVQVQI